MDSGEPLDKIFLEKFRSADDRFKAIEDCNVEPSSLLQQPPVLGKPSQPQTFNLGVGGNAWQLREEKDLQYLNRYVLFDNDLGLTAEELMKVVFMTVTNFATRSKNSQVFPASKTVVGYMFNQTNFAQYMVQMFQHKEKLGLKCNMLEGFAPIITDFWNNLQTALAEEKLLNLETDMEDDDDDSFFDDDSLDDGLEVDPLEAPLGLTPPGLTAPGQSGTFLDMAQEPEMFESFIEDLSDPNVMLASLMQLSHNVCDAANMETLIRNQFAQPLFDAVIACMIASEATVPYVYCASIVVQNLLKESINCDLEVSARQYTEVVNALEKWNFSEPKNAFEFEVTKSEDIAGKVSNTLEHLTKLASVQGHRIQIEALENIRARTSYAAVRTSLGKAIQIAAV